MMAEEEIVRARIAKPRRLIKSESEAASIGRRLRNQSQSSTDDDSDLSDKCECCQRVTFPGQNSCVIEPCGHLVCFCCLLEAGMIAFMSRRLPRCPCLEELNCDEPVSKATILDVKDKRKSVSGIWSDILSLMESYEAAKKIPSASKLPKEQELCKPEDEQLCEICQKTKALKEFCQMTECGHIFCSACLLEMVGTCGKMKTAHLVTDIRCPGEHCNKIVTCLDLIDVLAYNAQQSKSHSKLLEERRHHGTEDINTELEIGKTTCARCPRCTFVDANSTVLSCEHIICFLCLREEALIAVLSFREAQCPVETCLAPIARQLIEKLVCQKKDFPGKKEWEKLLEREIVKSVHETQWSNNSEEEGPQESGEENQPQNQSSETFSSLSLGYDYANTTEKESQKTETGDETTTTEIDPRDLDADTAEDETNSTERETDTTEKETDSTEEETSLANEPKDSMGDDINSMKEETASTQDDSDSTKEETESSLDSSDSTTSESDLTDEDDSDSQGENDSSEDETESSDEENFEKLPPLECNP